LGADGRTAVAAAVLGSPEYRADVVTREYGLLLGRSPDPGGLVAWTAALGGGASFEDLVSGLVGSGEFYSDATG
jgi:hypothetical protein